MEFRPLIAEVDLVLIIVVVLFAVPFLGSIGLMVWGAISDSATVLAGRRRSGGRRKPHFSLAFLFVLTAAVAASVVICRACGAEVGVPLLLYGLLSTVLLTAGCYFVYFLLEDFLIDTGWLTPRTSVRRRLFARPKPPQDPFSPERPPEEIVIREPAEQESSQGEKHPKKRRWWTKAMPNRTRTYAPGRDYEIPRDRDDYSG